MTFDQSLLNKMNLFRERFHLSLIIAYLSIKNRTNLDYAVYSIRNQHLYGKAVHYKLHKKQ